MKLPPEIQRKCLDLAGVKPTVKRPKYGSKPVFVTPDGLIVDESHTGPKSRVADSRKEWERLVYLQHLQTLGVISKLRSQVPFDLVVHGTKICTYVADAVYEHDGKFIVEDVKSDITRRNRAYRIKRKLMQAIYNLTVHEV